MHSTAAKRLTDPEIALQTELLATVSRTFALTIPQLPAPLAHVVGNAYLLCRVADTVEDEPALAPDRKQRHYATLNAVLANSASAKQFATDLGADLSPATPFAEHHLIAKIPEVVAIFQRLGDQEKAAINRCVRIMSEGMREFEGGRPEGLADIHALERYCYFVAGVVGEMLTELFCAYSKDVATQRDGLSRLAVPFGIGLQLTNILKDVWDDQRRGAVWLPGSSFNEGSPEPNYEKNAPSLSHQALTRLIAHTRANLQDALNYTLLIPAEQTAIRRFCLRALGLAILTLRKIHAHRDYRSGQDVKISRNAVKMVLLATDRCAGHDATLRALFALASTGLPAAARAR